MEEHTPKEGRHGIIEKIAYSALGIVAFLIPLFFTTGATFSPQVAKVLLLSIGTIVSFVAVIVTIIKSGRISVPKNLLSLSLALIPVTFLLSALMNAGTAMQYIGYNFEIGTVSVIAMLALMSFLVSELYQKKERVFTSYLAFFVTFALLSVYQSIRIFSDPGTLSFGLFPDKISNVIGNWNDLAVFFGASALLALVTLEMLQLKKIFKIVIYGVFIISLDFLSIVNFQTTWIILALFSVIVFVYVISFERFAVSKEFSPSTETQDAPRRRRISYPAVVMFVVSLAFIFFGPQLGDAISGKLNVSSVEVRPSWGATFTVIQKSLAESPVFGSGPNSFMKDWYMYRPADVNNTVFWGTEFPFGFGLVPTFFAMTGFLGIIAWIFFFGILLWKGFRAIFQSIPDLFSRYLITSSFLLSVYFWIAMVVYVPSIANAFLAFFFTGLFTASLYREKLLAQREVSLINHPKLSFASVLVLVVLLIGSLSLGYSLVQKATSLSYFRQSVLGFQKNQDISAARLLMNKAALTGGYDLYYRGLSELSLVQLDQILAREGVTVESVKDEFQIALTDSIDNARKATEVNPHNYQNWVGLARVYAALVPAPFTVQGAYENSKAAYEEALVVNPYSPVVNLFLARLEVAKGDLKAARVYVNKALTEKSNYAEGHLLLSQIEVTEGNLAQAIPSLENAVLLSPGNPGLYFQLGLLKYNQRDYNGAAIAFESAIKVVPEYANAKYFYGLSAAKLGRNDVAVAAFENLNAGNPNNPEITSVLANLKAGKDPFAGIKAPANKPETRSTLPLKQEN